MSSPEDNCDEESLVNILIATDNHLGYCEKDAIRGDDSFITFEEILELAVEKDVDFILLGGDLFHDATPSQNSLHRCLKLLRLYTLGDRPISLEFVSDQSLAFHDALNQTVNYEDPNINVSIPVFSIHGNHDDPSGFGRLSSLNLLATTGLINYFGRWTDLSQVDINPILLRKGETQIALYGLSHIHDGRLNRLFQSGKVIMEQPDESTGEWFNLMVLHQNRADRGPKNYVPEEVLPEFLDLIVWGHEHDCRIVPEINVRRNFYVSQPGSSVATSLAEGESEPKHVAILQVFQKKFQIVPLPLQTVRPFIFESINLTDYTEELGLDQVDAAEKVQKLAQSKIEEMIAAAEKRLTGHPKQPKLPLIRLRIVYHDESQMFNAIRFGQQYNKRIANPADVVIFKKLVHRTKTEQKFDKEAMDSAFKKREVDVEIKVEDIVDGYFDKVDETKKLQLINSKVLSEMCARIVEKNDVNAAETILSLYHQKAVEHLMSKLPDEDACDDEIQKFMFHGGDTLDFLLKSLDERGVRKVVQDDEFLGVAEVTKKSTSRSSKADEVMDETVSKPARGRGRGRGGGRGRGRGANTTTTGRAMPQLDISFGSKSNTSTRQSTLKEVVGARKSKPRNEVVYDISSDSD